jgi:uncharacterized membrane protein YdjX (TVP38/TMEM64 family)
VRDGEWDGVLAGWIHSLMPWWMGVFFVTVVVWVAFLFFPLNGLKEGGRGEE